MRPPLSSPASSRPWTTALGGIAEAFEDRNFRRYSIGSIISWLSFFVQAVAVSWTAWDLTHSTRWLALVALMDAIPNVILMPLGGVLADRVDRFRLLLVSYAFATLQAALLAGLAFAGQLTIERLAVLAILHGSIHAFSIPAQYGLLPRFVARRRLPSAISVASAYTQLGIFVGPALAGWVILHGGTAVAFASNVVGYCIYFAFILALRTPADYVQPPASGKAFIADLLDGLGAIARHGGLVALLTLTLCGDALNAAVQRMAPAFADAVLGAGVQGLSVLLACAGLGATTSALWLAQGGARRVTPPIIIGAFLGFLVSLAVLMTASGLAVAGLAMGGVGCFFEVCRTGTVSLLQMSVPDAVRGRVMSTQFLLMRLAGAIGIAGIGTVADGWGLRGPLLGCTAAAFLVWCVTYRRRGRIAAAYTTSRD